MAKQRHCDEAIFYHITRSLKIGMSRNIGGLRVSPMHRPRPRPRLSLRALVRTELRPAGLDDAARRHKCKKHDGRDGGAAEGPARSWSWSTVGRSGSSFLGELIAQLPDSLYFFEPMMFSSKATTEGVNPKVTWNLLRKTFSCQFDHDWLVFARSRNLVRKKEGKPCAHLHGEYARSCLRNLCLNQTNIVVKVIRMRVSWLADLLLEAGPELKVVHLVRDPRATFRSSKMFVRTQADYKALCPRILKDLQMIDTVKKLFPGRVTSVKYEDLCLDTKGVATTLWRFLSGAPEADLPPTWAHYLAEHTDGANRRGNAYSTWRDTRKEAEAWRQEIGESLLLAVEDHCGGAIDLLGHNKFHSLATARNLSNPLRWTRKPLYSLV
nr:carbohydrate sulfotransferase 5-like [Penaeus vannamei]